MISVIVPTRLRNHLLPRAIRSLLAQTCQDFEILIVDDNPVEKRVSSDPALRTILSDPKIRVLTHDQPRNAAAARNVGLQAARGEWITYLDDDDSYQPAKLELQLRHAEKSRLPLGICGLTFHLRRRQRRRLYSLEQTSGPELLLLSFALPTLFHKHAPGLLFDENLAAGEDSHFFYRLIAHFKTDRVFNVPELLVDIYPQPGPRVNTNSEALWQAALLIHRDFASAYGQAASQIFLARSKLGYLKYQPHSLPGMLSVAAELGRLRGRKEARFIINALLFKAPFARRFLVH